MPKGAKKTVDIHLPQYLNDFDMNENESIPTRETLYWQSYEKELGPLAEEISEHAGYLAYHLNPIGRYKEEYEMFVGNALQEVAELETRLEKMKKLLLVFR